MPMGNPLSPTIADIVLDRLLTEVLETLKQKNIQIKFIVKYVDDILAIIKDKDKKIILDEFNKYHPKLQFTTEEEIENSLPFLDIKLTKRKNRIITNWYQKPLASGRMINYNSNQPKKYKINTAVNLINKMTNISHPEFLESNYKIISNLLFKNNFPTRTIRNLIEESKQKRHILEEKSSNNNTTLSYSSVKYIPGLTDNKTI